MGLVAVSLSHSRGVVGDKGEAAFTEVWVGAES